jgi:hypothetical protein
MPDFLNTVQNTLEWSNRSLTIPIIPKSPNELHQKVFPCAGKIAGDSSGNDDILIDDRGRLLAQAGPSKLALWLRSAPALMAPLASAKVSSLGRTPQLVVLFGSSTTPVWPTSALPPLVAATDPSTNSPAH